MEGVLLWRGEKVKMRSRVILARVRVVLLLAGEDSWVPGMRH